MAARYPNRSKFHANRVTRLMAKACAAQEIGTEGAWLVAVVAGVEDAKRYTGAVTFYNEQLMPLCGFGSRSTLVRARSKAVDAGWLYYEPGGKGTPGRYWSTIPAEYRNLGDNPVDETPDDDQAAELVGSTDVDAWLEAAEARSPAGLRLVSPDDDQAGEPSKCRTETVRQTDQAGGKCRTKTVRQPSGKAYGKRAPFYPNPNPNPKEKRVAAAEAASPDQVDRKPAEDLDGDLARIVAWWNGLSAAGLVRAAVRADPVSSAVAAGFRRYKRSAELRELLADLDQVAGEIKASSFVRNAGWFTLAKLLGGKNKAGEYIAEILTTGGYRDDKPTKQTGPGQRFAGDDREAGSGAARFRATRGA